MDINYESARFWLTILNMAATLVVFTYIAVTRKSQVNAEKLERFEREVSDLLAQVTERTIRLESRPNHKSDITELHQRLNGISRDLAKMNGEFSQTAEAVKRMHDYMIIKGGKK